MGTIKIVGEKKRPVKEHKPPKNIVLRFNPKTDDQTEIKKMLNKYQ